MQTVTLQEQHVWDPVSKRKQLQAFPPNFIHSLDATHMLLSALKCTEEGMTFASIHDSFWTHASDVDDMSRVLRDAFVTMHREDIVGRLRQEFQARYKGFMYMASVVAHSPVGRKIAECRADLRKDESLKMSELALEAERIRLKNSDDPEEVKKGQAMVTPGSIYESEVEESAFNLPLEMAGQKLGELPSQRTAARNRANKSEAATTSTSLEDDIEDTNTDADVLAADMDDLSPEDLPDGAASSLDEMADEEALLSAETSVGSAGKGEKKPGKRHAPRKIHVWLPLTFPEVPEKGDFDVSRLMQSQYFFH
jgi:DNA-directed RNA polymerase